jgi:sulfate adenylyltransferase
MHSLVSPHGGSLVRLLADEQRAAELKELSRDWPSLDLSARQECDLELMLTGGLSPLGGFMGRADHAAVCERMRLADGTLWPIPVVLDVEPSRAEALAPGDMVALRDAEGVMLAALQVDEVWERDLEAEAEAVLGTADRRHPEVAALLDTGHRVVVAGRVEGVQLPVHHDYRELRLTPEELRRKFARLGWRKVIAYQTVRPMQRAEHEMTRRSALDAGANLLLHPVVGMSQPGDVDHYLRVRCYRALLPHYPPYMARMSLLPLALRKAGPRAALWHAIINKNHGCSHFLVEDEHAGVCLDGEAGPFYEDGAALDAVSAHAAELEVSPVRAERLVYLAHRRCWVQLHEVPADARVLEISDAELERLLARGRELPEWFTFASVARELVRAHPPRSRQGLTVFFTGLSGSGKSTVANALRVKLLEIGGRGVTLLDGDLVRRHLSSELGFSKEHRDINIRRIGFVAGEITRAGGIAICAPIAPYDSVRKQVRAMVEPCGGFVLVHMATPLAVCEARDRKGIYAKARAGLVKEFTGISDPYEDPQDADVVIDTSTVSPEEATREILLYLESEGFISADAELAR